MISMSCKGDHIMNSRSPVTYTAEDTNGFVTYSVKAVFPEVDPKILFPNRF